MARKPVDEKKVQEVDILRVMEGRFEVLILGRSPLILNRLTEKAKRELLMPAPAKNRAGRSASLKHDPVAEFRASAYRMPNQAAATVLAMPAAAFKRAIASAALDIPGAAKAQIGRLCWVRGEWVEIFGIPKMLFSVVRQAGINKTPDVRARVIIPEWAGLLRVAHARPILQPGAIANLIAAAGLYVGAGDWRNEKGAGSYGQWDVVQKGNAEHERILREGGRAAQLAALETPEPYDYDTADLLSWFYEEARKREVRVTLPGPTPEATV